MHDTERQKANNSNISDYSSAKYTSAKKADKAQLQKRLDQLNIALFHEGKDEKPKNHLQLELEAVPKQEDYSSFPLKSTAFKPSLEKKRKMFEQLQDLDLSQRNMEGSIVHLSKISSQPSTVDRQKGSRRYDGHAGGSLHVYEGTLSKSRQFQGKSTLKSLLNDTNSN